MSYYPDPKGDSSERLREEAKRDTEMALERERLQKKERDEQHKATLKVELRTLEEDLHQAERELGAIELERDHLASTAQSGKRGGVAPELERAVEREQAEVRTLETQTKTLDREEESLRQKLTQEEHRVATSTDSKLRTLEQDLASKERQLHELESDIRELHRKIEDTEHQDTNTTLETERARTKLKQELAHLEEQERQAANDLTRHKRELERAQQELRKAEQAAESEKDLGHTASLRMREKDERARVLARSIEEQKRKIEALKRDLGH